ncbi:MULTISPECIES: hypothetical protein [unclassified Bradyrhizobium]|uniref:hypothetical protein n=1 Tax=unclassified Bradyrhizobium TaxID=2631580 RepID=UPI001BA84741|nr:MULTISPECIES: hypothetical protein [unclassified Bradyrhizobium]MBR1225416.1 hypothetical protein [Bradyrhizobium sp. AUGA SZCCT0176]MBR1301535.1 hypothetical protein [Bradyrhizobium sp. AUGA SZCCT0042]
MSEYRDYSAGAVAGRFARAIGIVLIFSIAGPLTIAALISLIVVGFGAALLQMFLALLELEALRTIVSVAIVLLALATMLAAFLPSVAAGLIFALAAVYGGINMIWMAWLAAAIAVAGFVVFGIFLVPSESSAVILPDVRSARQALSLSAILAVLAVIPASLCWWLAKPLHRARTAA